MINKEKLDNLANELNVAHKKYLEFIDNSKSEDYKTCREEYFRLAKEFEDAHREFMNLSTKEENFVRKISNAEAKQLKEYVKGMYYATNKDGSKIYSFKTKDELKEFIKERRENNK